MTFRFTLSHSPQLPPFDQFETEAGDVAWDLDETPSISLPGPDSSQIQVDYVLLPGTYSIDYDITITETGIAVFNIDFDKTGHTVIVATDSSGNLSGAGDFTGTLNFTLDEASEGMQISFANFAANTKGLTINSLRFSSGPSQVISEPDGWEGAQLKLERDMDLFTLLETFNGGANDAFIFYGDNGTENGGIDFIRDIETNYGFDANITLLIEYAPDDLMYSTLFSGLLDLSAKNEMKDNKMQVPVIRDDFWTKFMNRFETPVNLSDTVDLDGDAVDVVNPVTLELSSQAVRFSGEYTWDESFTYEDDGSSTEKLYQIDWDKTQVDDLKKFNISRATIFPVTSMAEDSKLLTAQFEAPWDGIYTFDVRIVSSDLSTGPAWTANTGQVEFRIGRAGLTYTDHDIFSESVEGPFDLGGGLEDSLGIFTYQGSFTLRKGDQIVIYGRDTGITASGFDRTIFGETRWAYKTDCAAATTANVTLSGTQTIDGIALVASNRVLVKDQGTRSENGIYVVSAGAWSRATDADAASELNLAAVYVTSGTVNADSAWKQVNTISVLATDDIEWKFLTPSDERTWRYPPAASVVSNFCNVTADTTYPETEADGYLIHDLIYGVLARIGLGADPFYSEFLGSTLTQTRSYAEDGCGWMYAIVKGLQLRQYTLAEKPFFISFKDIWEGINPILNLGLGYEDINGSQVIRIEQKSHFVPSGATPSILFDNVREISASYDKDFIFKTIRMGYRQGKPEDISGLDDPYKQARATRIQKSGTDINLESGFIASGLSIEITRRNKKEKSKDYKFDDNNFIIALNTDDVSPDVYAPELDENFTSVSGILNSSSRYNLILTPLRNFLRWASYFGGCLQSYLSSSYKFVSGEGNYDLITDHACADSCQAIICDSISESDDISLATYNATFGHYFLPLLFNIQIDMAKEDYDQIDRKLPIGISQSTTGHVNFVIKSLKFDLIKGDAVIQAWPESTFNITVPEQVMTDPPCLAVPAEPVVFDADYQAVLDYGTAQGYTLPSDAQQIIENQTVLDAKSEGIWDDADLFYYMETDGDRDYAKINWKNPGTNNLTEVNTVTFTPGSGFNGNALNSYLTTGWAPDPDGVNFTLDECGIICKVNSELSVSGNFAAFGVRGNGGGALLGQVILIPEDSTSKHAFGLNNLANSVGSAVDSLGLYHLRRVADNDLRLLKNGVQVGATQTTASDSLSTKDLFVGALNANGGPGFISDLKIGVLIVGASFTGKETAINTIFG